MMRCAIFCMVLLPLVVAATAALADDWRLTTAGYGPAKIGMSVDETAQALGMKLVAEGPVDNPECHYLRPEPAVEGLWLVEIGSESISLTPPSR